MRALAVLAPTRVGSLEEGTASLAELDNVQEEMNAIAYGNDSAKRKAIFGDNVFAIQWTFSLKNLTTGRALQIPTDRVHILRGQWPDSKISFAFPPGDDLLEFTASAAIKDALGNGNVAPILFTFWNEQIDVAPATSASAIPRWLGSPSGPHDHSSLLGRAMYLAEDGTLTPGELRSLLR